MSSWFSFRPSPAFSSADPDDADAGKNLEWLEATLEDDMAWLDGVEAMADIDAQTEIAKEELKEWAYDAEDLLDEWKFQQLGAAVEAPPSPRYAPDPVAGLLMDPSFGRRVDGLRQSRVEIGEFNHMLRLGKAQGPRRYGINVEPPPTSSLPGEQHIYGRGDDKGIFLGFLLEGAMEDSWNVVPIVGAAGVGKTTLVQHIYNDPAVSEHFDLRGWVSGARGLQMMELLRKIGEALTGMSSSYNQLEAVQNHLKVSVNGRRFLLVLDDIWYETVERDHWENLLAAFDGCAYGSVIILTTHDERVADETETVPHYILESLLGDPCWSVFQKHAFGSLPTDAGLVEIGKKIAKECRGFPLVAKAFGVRLCRERDAEKWEEFSHRDMWDEVGPELEQCYRQLAPHLKRCFVYCSMFPKGYLFNREELVRLWMAQGFIEEDGERLLEDIGLKYFDDLSIMSFFQKSELDAGAFVLPNLLHALARSISDDQCVTIEDNNLNRLSRNNPQKLHHLSMTPSNGELTTQFLSYTTHLRSFLVVPTWPLKKIAHLSLSDKALLSLSRLRVLDVRHTDIEDLPDTIGELKHLRYLNLSGTKVKGIHASVFRLYNLQTLDLSCTAIEVLPVEIGNLSNLLHLRLNVTKIRKIPESIGKLSKLQSLHLGVTKIEELPETIGSLKSLKFLCLNVSKIQRPPASIRGLSELRALELQGVDDGDSEEQLNEHSDQSVVYQDVSDVPDCNVKYLTSRRVSHNDDQGSSSNNVVKVEDVQFLMWMGDPSLSNLTYVVLKNCMMCKTLPQLGQLPLLKELDIDGMLVEHVGRAFCSRGDKDGFTSLEKLSFKNMCKWQKWDGVEKGDFPHLHEVVIFNCPKLKAVPHFHSSLTKLKVERCAVSTIPGIDSLEQLELYACDNISELPSLSSLCDLTLAYCKDLRSLPSTPLLENLWVEECEHLSLPSNLEIRRLSSTSFLAVPAATAC